MNNFTRITTGIVAVSTLGALTLTGCAASGEETSSDAQGTVNLGYLPGWTDALSMAYLLQDQFEKRGYDVEMTTLTEAGPLYTGIAEQQIDLYPSAWSDVAQVQYIERYGDALEDLGAYYEQGTGLLAVPTYMDDINTISDLLGKSDLFEGKIYTIEPGSGTVAFAESTLLSSYGLDAEYELITSSTAGMLAQLEGAIAADENVVVTMWKPWWAIDAYDIKQLEDDQNVYQVEGLHFVGHSAFRDEFPDLAEMLGEITLDDAQYASLEDMVVNEYGEGREAEAIDAWIADHADEFDWLIE